MTDWQLGTLVHPGDGQMVREVELHLLEIDALEVALGHDTGGQGERGAVLEEFVTAVDVVPIKKTASKEARRREF